MENSEHLQWIHDNVVLKSHTEKGVYPLYSHVTNEELKEMLGNLKH